MAGVVGAILGAFIGIGSASDGTTIGRGIALGFSTIAVMTLGAVAVLATFTGATIWELFEPAGVAFAAMLLSLLVSNAASKWVSARLSKSRSKSAA